MQGKQAKQRSRLASFSKVSQKVGSSCTTDNPDIQDNEMRFPMSMGEVKGGEAKQERTMLPSFPTSQPSTRSSLDPTMVASKLGRCSCEKTDYSTQNTVERESRHGR